MSDTPNVIWEPTPGSQSLAVSCPCKHILYEGSRGPGKTDSQLMAFRKNVGLGYGAHWRGIVLDREYKNLDDLVMKSKRWFPDLGNGARFLLSTKDYKWIWETGEELLFRSMKDEREYWAFHGHEYPFIAWNELTKYPTRKAYEAMMSCNRSSFVPLLHSPGITEEEKDAYKRGQREGNQLRYVTKAHAAKALPEIPLTVFSTTNPFGVGHNWVKKDFIDVAPAGKVVRKTINVFNPRTKAREDVVTEQVRIFGSYKENIYLSPSYIAELEGIKEENKRRAWLYGDWDIVAGGALDDVWNEAIHVVPRFPVPDNLSLDRSFDWGSTHPFSVGWWFEANGEEIEMPDGKYWTPPAGSLIRFHEWYGTNEIGSNEGLKMDSADVAVGIKRREEALKENGWIFGEVSPGPADNQIRNVTDKKTETIEKKMKDKGVSWLSSDKSKGSRKMGLELVRQMLTNAARHAATGEDVGPGIYFMDHCRAAISILPTLPRDEDNPDDVDTEAEDHPYDDTRYRVLAGNNRAARSLKVKHAT
jgi:hypothetical protein